MQPDDATWNSTLMHPKRIDSIAGVLEMNKKEIYTDQCRFSVGKSAALGRSPSDYFQINQREAISAIQFVRIQAEWISESIRKNPVFDDTTLSAASNQWKKEIGKPDKNQRRLRLLPKNKKTAQKSNRIPPEDADKVNRKVADGEDDDDNHQHLGGFAP